MPQVPNSDREGSKAGAAGAKSNLCRPPPARAPHGKQATATCRLCETGGAQRTQEERADAVPRGEGIFPSFAHTPISLPCGLPEGWPCRPLHLPLHTCPWRMGTKGLFWGLRTPYLLDSRGPDLTSLLCPPRSFCPPLPPPPPPPPPSPMQRLPICTLLGKAPIASPQKPENNKTSCLQIILIFFFLFCLPASPPHALSLDVQRGIEDVVVGGGGGGEREGGLDTELRRGGGGKKLKWGREEKRRGWVCGSPSLLSFPPLRSCLLFVFASLSSSPAFFWLPSRLPSSPQRAILPRRIFPAVSIALAEVSVRLRMFHMQKMVESLVVLGREESSGCAQQ